MCVKMNLFISFFDDIYELYFIINMKMKLYKRHIAFEK